MVHTLILSSLRMNSPTTLRVARCVRHLDWTRTKRLLRNHGGFLESGRGWGRVLLGWKMQIAAAECWGASVIVTVRDVTKGKRDEPA